MFFLSHIWLNIWRNKIRGLLTIGITMLLLSFMGVYLGNVEKNQITLNKLSGLIPVEALITNQNGTRNVGLEIDTNKADSLLSSKIQNPVYTAQAAGNFELINRVEHVRSCDTSIVGANNFSAFTSVSPETVKMATGRSSSFLTGNEPVCLVSNSYSAKHGIALGQKLRFPLYTYYYNADGSSFTIKTVGNAELTVIGTFLDETTNSDAAEKDMIVPVGWLRSFVERNNVPFYYDSFRFALKNPLQLNEFKSNMANLYFSEVRADAPDQRIGNTLMIQDKIFIENATKLRQNVDTLQHFQLPVFIITILLMVLVMFLLLRSRRREIAIACSLGQKKILIALELFVEGLLLVLAGCVLAVPVLCASIGSGLWDGVAICLPFLGCSCLGIWIALFMLLRFDVLSLLTKMD